ncbi:hypothetical protein N9933_01110 [bacterium]|nr:hypothetical protein [bacterium]
MNSQVNKAINKLSEVSKTLIDQTSILDKYTYEKLSEVLIQIDSAMDKLSNIDLAIVEKERIANLDLSLRIKENEKNFFDAYMHANSYVSLTKEAYKLLLQEEENVKKDLEKAIEVTTAVTMESMETEHKLKGSQKEIHIATLMSSVAHLKEQISFYKKELDILRTELSNSSTKMVEVAKASAQGSANISLGK